MKKFILAQALFFICIISYSQTTLKTFKTWYDPYSKTKIHELYTTLTVAPYLKHGIYKEYDERGILLKEWNYLNGKLNGLSKNYFGFSLAAAYDNSKCYIGKVFTQSNYVNDEPRGIEIMYDYSSCVQRKLKEITWANGVQIKSISYHDNGNKMEELVSNGACISYFPDGKIKSKYTMVDGVPQGAYSEFYQSGKIYSKSKYKDGALIDTLSYFFENGKIQEFSIADGDSPIGKKSEVYATNGNLKMSKSKIDNLSLNVIEYDTITKVITAKYTEKYNNSERKLMKVGQYEIYEKGKLREVKNFDRDSKQNGTYIMYDIKGDTVIYGQLANGKFHGRWIFLFDENWEHPIDLDSATYFRIAEFQYGNFYGTTKDFYMDKTLQWEGRLIGMYPDVIDGYSIYYYLNGKKQEEGGYSNGEKKGEWKYYKEDGTLDKTESY